MADTEMLTPPNEAQRRAAEQARIEREAAAVAQAEADIDAGLGIDGEVFEAWLDRLQGDPDAPLPVSESGLPVPSR